MDDRRVSPSTRVQVLDLLAADAPCPNSFEVYEAAAHIIKLGLTVAPAEVAAILDDLPDIRVQEHPDYVAELAAAVLATAMPMVSWRSADVVTVAHLVRLHIVVMTSSAATFL